MLASEEVEELYNTRGKEIDSSDSSYVIDITEEEVNLYSNNDAVQKKMTSLFDVKLPKIEKVPLILSENPNFQKYYKPKLVSIGPYHHGSPNLNMMEKVKLKIVVQFIEKHHLKKEVIYSKIMKEIIYLREFYEEEAIKNFEDDYLAWMFFLDGCLILHYIHYNMKDEEKNAFRIWNIDILTLVTRDLFLLENQLPYRVFELVISCLSDEDKKIFLNSIEDFICHSIKVQWEMHEEPNYTPDQNKGSKHLLDLLRTKILQSDEKQSDEKSTKLCSIIQRYLGEIMREPFDKIRDLTEYIGKALENFTRKPKKDLQFSRSAEELKAAGIRLKPKNTSCVTDIDFNLGTLKIHPIKLDDTTATLVLNLIAYEMGLYFPNDFGISSYIGFLDSLIDHPQDVKEFRDGQILRNVLCSNEEVAKLFNELGTNLVLSPNKYSKVKKNIQKRYQNIWMTWIYRLMHQLVHQYFQSPWSVIAFVAAIAILALTAIQTHYSVKGYYK